MARNWYADVIGVITANSAAQSREILIQVAKTHPKAVVQAAELLSDDWSAKLRKKIREGSQKIPLIKLCRELTGFSLNEAKKQVEILMEQEKEEPTDG